MKKSKKQHYNEIKAALKCDHDHETQSDCPRCLRRQGLLLLHLAACDSCRKEFDKYQELEEVYSAESDNVRGNYCQYGA